jgi:hypothetical protein
MKYASLFSLSLLAILSAGCYSNYGPGSPDYYPDNFPFARATSRSVNQKQIAAAGQDLPVSAVFRQEGSLAAFRYSDASASNSISLLSPEAGILVPWPSRAN